jgi:methyl-accepting chemotaxis protein
MPMSVMFCDRDLVIRYSNQESFKQLRRLEENLPVRAADIVGESLDVFQTQPADERSILGGPAGLPQDGRFKIGNEHVRLEVSAIHDAAGEHIGHMAAWSIVTSEVLAAQRDVEHTAELERVLEQVAQYSNGVASASTQLTSISQQMAANAEETSAQAAVVSTTSDHMNVSTNVVTQAMDEIRAGIGEVARNASEASRVASQAVEAARSSNNAVQKLAESSNEIGNVVEVISSIAEETNLLALNATIEAARAGEAGKGFAVVANEVKELASETGRATGDIKRKIDAIQADTRAAIEAIGQISDIINTINDAQHSIAIVVEEQTASAAEMARNVADVASGSASIAANIGGVADAAQSTSIGAAETESAASELAQMAAELQRIVSASGEGTGPASASPASPARTAPQADVAAKLAAALR